ncbi:MAG: hypothetical protein ACI91F_002457 [Candidatus Binatia bacterium]
MDVARGGHDRRDRCGVNHAFARFLAQGEQDRRDVFLATAAERGLPAHHVEKDFWVCLVLDILHNGLPVEHPRSFFKGGTSLAKVWELINRFSEDIDIIIDRSKWCGDEILDPFCNDEETSKKERTRRFERLQAKCANYVGGDLRGVLEHSLNEMLGGCEVEVDPADELTLLVGYPTLTGSASSLYVKPKVKIEAGARGATAPKQNCSVEPYIDQLWSGGSLQVDGISTITAERTFWEKVVILHGIHCGYRDEGRGLNDRHRLSRHYYDVAKILESPTGESALDDIALLDHVAKHNDIAFPQAWKKFSEAKPGTLVVIPPGGLREAIRKDYELMEDMIVGDAESIEWVLERLERIHERINTA